MQSCPICETQAVKIKALRASSIYEINCSHCGLFQLTDLLFLSIREEIQKDPIKIRQFRNYLFKCLSDKKPTLIFDYQIKGILTNGDPF